MNFPVWDVPSSGLFIALIAVLHVFISHFAVGGGLFLVVTGRRARRHGDEALLAYVRRHSRFFVLLTLVLGAITGVGIWFTIGLVHPQATSTLIQVWVWTWAIEWTFFVTEIAAAMVYYYGWDRLTPARHLAVGSCGVFTVLRVIIGPIKNPLSSAKNYFLFYNRVRAAVLREMKLIFPLWFTICRSNANLNKDIRDSSGRQAAQSGNSSSIDNNSLLKAASDRNDIAEKTECIQKVRFTRCIRPNQKDSLLQGDIDIKKIPPVF